MSTVGTSAKVTDLRHRMRERDVIFGRRHDVVSADARSCSCTVKRSHPFKLPLSRNTTRGPYAAVTNGRDHVLENSLAGSRHYGLSPVHLRGFAHSPPVKRHGLHFREAQACLWQDREPVGLGVLPGASDSQSGTYAASGSRYGTSGLPLGNRAVHSAAFAGLPQFVYSSIRFWTTGRVLLGWDSEARLRRRWLSCS